ncbi:hypothetical protein NTGM5_130134 [Candidatus Nitrotoga sp. M5]|nr:hypothetical protein NTGM5_130134 [Candidatus Nitrotoga sp. M5]
MQAQMNERGLGHGGEMTGTVEILPPSPE